MGVMACNRNDCTSTMCTTYIPDFGYICRECQKEFKEYLMSIGLDSNVELSEGELIKHLKDFKKTNCGNFYKGNKTTIDQFFTDHTH